MAARNWRCLSSPAAGCVTSSSGRTSAPADIPRDNQENLEAAIHRALELGINHIETARGYGTSEMQLGNVLPKLPRDKIIVQTKVRRGQDPEEFLKTFDKSMEYLRLDHVDLLSLHGVNNRELLDLSLRKTAASPPPANCKGKAASGSSAFPRTRPRMSSSTPSPPEEFDYVNLHWYFVNDLNWPAIVAARKRDMGVFIISPNDKGGKLI